MFRLLEPAANTVMIFVGGKEVTVPAGANLAAALLLADFSPFRHTPVSASARSAYCMMGVCFDCLAVVDGVPNRQTCLETVRDGMRVERQHGAVQPGDPE